MEGDRQDKGGEAETHWYGMVSYVSKRGFSLKEQGKNMVVLFEVHAVTCRNIRTTADYWRYIIEVKHPESFKHIAEPSELVMETLSKPKIVVREKLDPDVYLYYKRFGEYFICVVAKHLNGDGYIITAYKTDRVKKGEIIWQRE